MVLTQKQLIEDIKGPYNTIRIRTYSVSIYNTT